MAVRPPISYVLQSSISTRNNIFVEESKKYITPDIMQLPEPQLEVKIIEIISNVANAFIPQQSGLLQYIQKEILTKYTISLFKSSRNSFKRFKLTSLLPYYVGRIAKMVVDVHNSMIKSYAKTITQLNKSYEQFINYFVNTILRALQNYGIQELDKKIRYFLKDYEDYLLKRFAERLILPELERTREAKDKEVINEWKNKVLEFEKSIKQTFPVNVEPVIRPPQPITTPSPPPYQSYMPVQPSEKEEVVKSSKIPEEYIIEEPQVPLERKEEVFGNIRAEYPSSTISQPPQYMSREGPETVEIKDGEFPTTKEQVEFAIESPYPYARTLSPEERIPMTRPDEIDYSQYEIGITAKYPPSEIVEGSMKLPEEEQTIPEELQDFIKAKRPEEDYSF